MKCATLFTPVLAAAWLLVSGCSHDPGLEGASGCLSVDLSTDASVEEISTRAEMAMPGLTAPENSEFNLKITGKASGEEVWSGVFTEYPNEKFPLEKGTYIATATYGDLQNEGFGLPAFGAVKECKIEYGENTPVDMTAKLVNMAVTIDYTDGFKGYFSNYSATISRSGTKIADFTATEKRAAYLKPEAFTVRVDYTLPFNGVSERKDFKTYNVTQNIGAATLLRVKFNANEGKVGNADITISFNDAEEVDLGTIDVGETEKP